MKSSLSTIAHTVRATITGPSHRKQANEGGSQQGPSSSASGDLASLSSSRSAGPIDAGATSARRNAQFPGTPSASISGGTPAASSREGGAASPGEPLEGVSKEDVLELAHDAVQSAIKRADKVVSGIEAAHGKLPADPIPLPATSTPDSPSSAATPQAQAPGPQDELAQVLAPCAGKLEVRPPDTSGTHDLNSRLNALREMFASLTDVPEVLRHGTHDRSAHAQERAKYFDLMSELIKQEAGQSNIQMGSGDWQQLEELLKHSEELRECATRNPFTGTGAHQRHTNRMAACEIQARSALETLLHKHLPALLPEIKDPDMLVQLANDLLKPHEGRADTQASAAAPAASTNGWRELVAPIRADIELAKAEIDLQRKLLAQLGGAVLALGEAKIDGLHGGLKHRTRQLLHKKVAEKGGLDLRPRGEQVRDSVHAHLGDHFYVGVSTEDKDKLDLSVKQSSIGLVTIADLEAALDKLLQLKTPKFIPVAIREAVKKTEGFELTKEDGQEHVRLTEHEQQRLNAMRLNTLGGAKALPAQPSVETPATHRSLHTLMENFQQHIEHLTGLHGSHGTERHQQALAQAHNTLRALANLADMPPQQRLAQAATQAIQTVQFGVLKLSLIKSFSDPITKDRVGEAADQALDLAHPHPGLTHEKTELLVDTWKKVIGSHTTKEMLEHLTEAEQKHDEIWSERGRPHGGQTAELLKDLRSAIERF